MGGTSSRERLGRVRPLLIDSLASRLAKIARMPYLGVVEHTGPSAMARTSPGQRLRAVYGACWLPEEPSQGARRPGGGPAATSGRLRPDPAAASGPVRLTGVEVKITAIETYTVGVEWKNWLFLRVLTGEELHGVGEETVNGFIKAAEAAIHELKPFAEGRMGQAPGSEGGACVGSHGIMRSGQERDATP